MGDQELKIFVGGVHPETTKDSLNSHFSQYGFADSYVMMDKATGRSRGFGFVNFKDEQTMNTVLSMDHSVDGTPITCTEYKKGSSKGSKGPPAGGAYSQAPPAQQGNSNPEMKVFVGGLAQETSKEILDMYFLQFGPADSYVMTDKATGRSRGFGFVNFRDEETLSSVLEIKNHQVDGVPVSVSEYSKGSGKGSGNSASGKGSGNSGGDSWHDAGASWPRAVGMTGPQYPWRDEAPRRSSTMSAREEPSDPNAEIKVFVGGLSQDTSKESLNRHFSRWGTSDAYIMMDRATGRSRGFGFVNFRSNSTKNAVLAAGPHRVNGQTIECRDYAKGSSKGDPVRQPEPQRRRSRSRPASRRPAAAAVNTRGRQSSATGGEDTANLLRTIQDQLQALTSSLTSQSQNKEQVQNLQSAISSVTSALQPVLGQPASQGGHGRGSPSDDQLKVFVGGLSQDTTKRSLDAHFSQYGAADSYVMKDKATGRSRGFGFVNFRDAATKSVVLKLQHRIDNISVSCTDYKEGSDSSAPSPVGYSVRQDGGLLGNGGRHAPESTSTGDDSARIFVGGLPQSATDLSLQEAFAAYGAESSEIMMDNVSGRSRGFGFVQFESPSDAEMAMSAQPHLIDGKEVQCKQCRGKGNSKGGGPARFSPY